MGLNWIAPIVLAFSLFLGLLGEPLAFGESKPKNEETRISGSTTLLPFTQRAAEEFFKKYPGQLVSVSGAGTGEGIKSLIEGVADLAAASRDLIPVERERAEEAKVDLIRTVVAKDGLAVVIHPENPVQNLTMAQLRDIYLGRVRNWREVGGEDRVVVPINRDSSSGTFEMWVEKVLLGQKHRPDAQVQSSSGAVAYAVAGNRHAIGYVGLGFIDETVKNVAVDGVLATLKTVTDGSYPVARDLYVFSRRDSKESAKKFLGFLVSAEGQALLGAEGYAPAGN
jgi:phosphate transport system substrate-binding protein